MATAALDSVGYDGVVDEVAWARLAPYMGAPYGVGGPDDLKVEAVAGLTRTVRISAGEGFGRGVLDVFPEATLQLPDVPSGVRWDLIAARRDWQPPTGVSTLDYLTGTSTQVLPAGRLREPGIEDDQPLALVQCSATSTVPTAIIDLRVWHGAGGMYADNTAALAYLSELGSRVLIGPDEWVCTMDAADNLAWSSARLARPMFDRAIWHPRVSASPFDSYGPVAGGVNLLNTTREFAPPGWYDFRPQLSVVAESGTSAGYVVLNVNGTEFRCRADLDGVTRTFTPSFTYRHTADSPLTARLAHVVTAGVATVDNNVSGMTSVYLGP